MTKNIKDNIPPDLIKRVSIVMAVALLEDLHNKEMISASSMEKIEQDAKKMIVKLDKK